jgi:zinc-binding alcohol dehydrogenase/oxidoreductase
LVLFVSKGYGKILYPFFVSHLRFPFFALFKLEHCSMKALLLTENNQYPTLSVVPEPEVGQGQMLVKVKAAALNHRDVWVAKGKYPGIRLPIILGSDGAGLTGNRQVIIQPGLHWGGDQGFQAKNYQILGLPEDGTFAEYVLVYEHQLFDIPAHLSFEQAAALPLAGLTAFRVLFSRCKIQKSEKILITGIGGGVAVACLQFALAMGLEVYVTSGSNSKIEQAITMGAAGGVNYHDADWFKQLEKMTGGFDVVIDSAGGEGFTHLVKLCNPGARIGVYGGTRGIITNLSPQLIFWRQISILGSTMGSPNDFEEMLSFVNQHKIVPVVDSVYPLGDGVFAFKRMAEAKQFGKIVLKIS